MNRLPSTVSRSLRTHRSATGAAPRVGPRLGLCLAGGLGLCLAGGLGLSLASCFALGSAFAQPAGSPSPLSPPPLSPSSGNAQTPGSLTPARSLPPPVPAPTAPSRPAGSPGSPPATPSAEDQAAGKRHYRRGDELFKQGRYLEAAREFEAGFAVAPRPLFLLNIGHSYRKAQELRRARVAYEEFLKADPSSTYRPDVEDLMRTIDDALAASAMPAGPPPAGSNPVSPGPGLPPAAPPAGVPPASGPTIDLAPPVMLEASETTATTESSSIFRSPWFWGAVGVVVAAGVGGTVYGLSRPAPCNATRCLRETN